MTKLDLLISHAEQKWLPLFEDPRDAHDQARKEIQRMVYNAVYSRGVPMKEIVSFFGMPLRQLEYALSRGRDHFPDPISYEVALPTFLIGLKVE